MLHTNLTFELPTNLQHYSKSVTKLNAFNIFYSTTFMSTKRNRNKRDQ